MRRPRNLRRKRLGLRAKSSRLVREVRFARTKRALASRDRAQVRGRPHRAIPSPRLWQRFLVTPIFVLVNAVRSLLAWLRDIALPAPPPVLPFDPEAFLVVAHRGAGAVAVENTIDAYERALTTEGANAIEVDLCVTKDRHVVVWHDWDPDELVAFARQAGAELDVRCRPVVPPEGDPMRRPVCELTLAQLRDHYGYALIAEDEPVPATLPLLEDVVRWAHRKPQLRVVFLDCKVPPDQKELVRLIAHELQRELARTPSPATFVLLSPHPEVQEELKAAYPAVVRSFDVEVPAGWFPDISKLSAVDRARAAGNAWASIGRPVFTVGGWPTYRRRILQDLETVRDTPSSAAAPRIPSHYVCWTINRRREMRHLLRMGVTGILTDFPKELRGLVQKAAAKQAERVAREQPARH